MKKLKKIVASLLAVLMLLGVAPVTALAGEIELHHINTTQQPAEEPAQEPVLGSEDVLPEEDVAEAAEPAAVSSGSLDYRIVHLDCGRKYFSVENIKKLIDTAAQYGYNQVQLAFGNGGCRFLLDDMSLSFGDVTISSDTVRKNITDGNNSFNGDTRCLAQSDMDAIIAYANTKGIEIVPMLNMPGHATAIVYNTGYANSGNLDVTNETARNYGYALLAKYVEYFKDKDCNYFHFGSDESGYTGTDMTAFLKGCADVITKAGMTPRAFNDATNVAIMPTSVQITYWHKENGSESASALANAGYSMINTHGRWYYVIKGAQNNEIGTKYWQGTVNTTATSVELPVLKAEKMDGMWVGINEYFDDNPGYGSTVSGSKGVMFCIWCDASQDSYLTDSDVISENKNYGALYQIEKLAEHYWPKDINAGSTDKPIVKLENGNDVPAHIKKGEEIVLKADKSVTWTTSNPKVIDLVSLKRNTTITADSVTAVAKSTGSATITATDETNAFSSYTINVKAADGSEVVEIKVGESRTFDAGSAGVGEYITTNDKYIATANVVEGEAQAAELKAVTAIESGKSYLIVNQRKELMLTATSGTDIGWRGLKLSGTPALTSTDLWKIEKTANGYTAAYKGDNSKYLTLSENSSSVGSTAQDLVLNYNANGYWNISYNNYYYLNNLGGGTVAGGWDVNSQGYDVPNDVGSRWTLYEIVEATTGGNTLTISGVGEGNTEVTVDGVKYTIKVTAPETAENKALAYGGSFSLPEGAEATIASGSEYVTISNGKVTAGQTDGTAVVNAVTKNAGGKITAKYVYTVTVSKVELGNVEPLSVELWITNTWVGAGSPPTSLQKVEIKAEDAYFEEGILLQSKVPSPAYKKDGENTKVIYWKGTVLHNGIKQVLNGADFSGPNDGDDFAKIRYQNNSWQYKFNGTWMDLDLSTDKDTVIAYYLQINNVSPEIQTATQHYGNPPTDHPGSNSNNGYNMTAFAVVYPDGTLSRTEQQMYETGMMRGYWGGSACNIGTVYAENNSEYKVSKITLTWGDNILGTSGDDWYTGKQSGTYGVNWGVKWEKELNDAGIEWYKETTYWDASKVEEYGEIPMIDGEKLGINFNYNEHRNAALVLIYLEAIASDDNLNVVYWDDDADKQINPNLIQIVVKNGVTYLDTEKGLKKVNPLKAGEITLPDNAYIENSSGVKQTFNKDITIINDVAANYRSGIYEYKRAVISDDGKTLTLHYNLKPVTSIHEYVVDFGLPVKFTGLLSWFNVTDGSTVNYLSVAKFNTLTDSTGAWGRIVIDTKTWDSMTYTLDKMLSATAVIPLYCNLKNGTQLETQIKVIPATTVYYEDSFVDFYDVGSSTKKTAFTQTTENDAMGVWYVEGNANTTAEQALSKLGDKAIYGYDPAYNNSTMFSMDSAKKVTVNTNGQYAQAKFTFKGTGFDVISLTNSDSGAITVEVLKDGTTAKTKDGKDAFYLVNNYYGYKQENGQWVVDPTATNTLYQIPVMKVSGLNYDTYTAVITVDYAEFFNKTNDNKYSFWLDAIRIYDPMGVDNETYTKDDEGFPQYIKLRKELAENSSITTNTNLLFIDGKDKAEISEYKNFGPNNEVYLARGQAISFKLEGNLDKIASVQIGAKAPNGNANLVVNSGEAKEIATATEMYYEISKDGNGNFTVTNTGTGILSLTNLKITYSEKGSVSLVPMRAEERTSAVMMVRAMFAPPAPTVFEPETFTVSLKNYKDVYVREYIKVTVTTSDDVKYITVGDKKISSYDDERVWGGFRKGFVKTGKRIWSYYVSFNTAGQQVISVVAYDADGLASEAVENTVNIKPRSAWRGKKSEWHI